MREAGWGLICLGLLALVGAFLFVDVSREIGTLPYASEYLPGMPRSVANVHAMHIQSLVFHTGLASFLAGVICIGAATIDEAIRRNDPKPDATTPVTPQTTSATSEEIAAAAAYMESAESEPEVPTGGWLGVAVATVIIIGLIVVFAVSSGGSPTSSISANNAISNIELMNEAGNIADNLENAAYPDLNLAAE
jgi:hypothetical protein